MSGGVEEDVVELWSAFGEDREDLIEFGGEEVERGENASVWTEIVSGVFEWMVRSLSNFNHILTLLIH